MLETFTYLLQFESMKGIEGKTFLELRQNAIVHSEKGRKILENLPHKDRKSKNLKISSRTSIFSCTIIMLLSYVCKISFHSDSFKKTQMHHDISRWIIIICNHVNDIVLILFREKNEILTI